MADTGSTLSKAATLPVVMFSETDLSDLPVINGPLSLRDAIDTALRNNLSLKVNQYEVKVNKAHVRSESAKLWPTISAFSLTFLIGGNSAVFRAPGLLYPVINFHKVDNKEFGFYAVAIHASTKPSVENAEFMGRLIAYRKSLNERKVVYRQPVLQPTRRPVMRGMYRAPVYTTFHSHTTMGTVR